MVNTRDGVLDCQSFQGRELRKDEKFGTSSMQYLYAISQKFYKAKQNKGNFVHFIQKQH